MHRLARFKGTKERFEMASNETAPAPAEAGGPPRDGSVKKLKEELMIVKELWGKEIKLVFPGTPKGEPGFPYPVSIQRKITAPPEVTNWDVENMVVKLIIQGADKDELPVKVVAPNPALPKAVRRAIAEAVEAQWKEMLVEAEEGSNWQLAAIFDWTKSKWVQLLGSLPEYIERYDTGFSELRFSVREPQESESESSTDEEEEARIEALREARLDRAYQKALDLAEKKEIEAEEARVAAELGHDSSLEIKKVSKKEQEALLKEKADKKGSRQAKTGQKHSKYAGDDSAVEKAKKAGKPAPGSAAAIKARRSKE